MTKNERAYISQLVNDANWKIRAIKNGAYLENVYTTDAERMAAMQMIANTIEPFAVLIGKEVVNF